MAEHFFGITDTGKRRQKNEDTFIVQELNKELLLACVIDGVGGYNGGDIAAGIARSVIPEQLRDLTGDISGLLRHAIVVANAKIREEKKKDSNNEQMACVLTCAITDIKNNKFYYAHVGDTRLYLLRDHSLVKLSKDHSVVGFLEDSGRLTEEDAMRHPRRNEINKALGFEENINDIKDFIETGESPFLPGDTILLCSDGLSDMISSDEILSILDSNNSIPCKTQLLVNAANEAGGNDNITVVIVENNKPIVPREVLKPTGKKNEINKSKLHAIKSSDPSTERRTRKTNHSLVVFLTVLTLGLLVILLFQKSTRLKANNIVQKAKQAKHENIIWHQLTLPLADSTKQYVVKDRDAVIKLSAPLLINKDSFRLLGNGATIVCDSNYKGPAFMISNSSKQIILDSLVFKNFDVAIIMQKNNIRLKNVRFINCRVPVQYDLLFRDSVVSGRFNDSIFIPGLTLK